MPYISVGPCDCCGDACSCPGCRYAILVYRNDGTYSGDDYDLYVNGTFVARLEETEFNWCQTIVDPDTGEEVPMPCRGHWVKPPSLSSTGPSDLSAFTTVTAAGTPCSGTPSFEQITTSLLEDVTDCHLYIEVRSVVSNLCRNDGWVLVYRVCDGDDTLCLVTAVSLADMRQFGSGGAGAMGTFLSFEDGVDTDPTCCVTDNALPALHTDKVGARNPCCGDVVIPTPLYGTFVSDSPAGCTAGIGSGLVDKTLEFFGQFANPVFGTPEFQPYWRDGESSWDYAAGCNCGSTDPDTGALTDCFWVFGVGLSFLADSSVIVSCDPLHIQFFFSGVSNGCAWQYDLTE